MRDLSNILETRTIIEKNLFDYGFNQNGIYEKKHSKIPTSKP